MRVLFDWLDARTGYRSLLAPLRTRILPDGPSWWLTSASCLAWVFAIELVTGLLLMTTYSPSTTSAWASVHYIEQSPAGRFVRGVHYFASHALIVLLAVHVLRVLVYRAYRAPRELIWISGLLLMPLVIAWAVTGNPLSASQKAVTQIEVEANIIGSTPLVGPAVQRLLLGGDEVGHLTFTHLYFLHVGLLPLVGLALLAVHLSQVYRHAVVRERLVTSGQALPYWPYQSVRNATVATAVTALIGWLAWRRGAPLEAPADADLAILPRPEWYFRSLFELRRYFTGDWEFIATLVVPLATLLFFLAIPFFDRYLPRRVAPALRWSIVILAIGAWDWLTWTSLARDAGDAEYQAARVQAAELSQRARQLAAARGIPPEGASSLLRDDAETQGPLLFQRHCASCHSRADSGGAGIVATEPSAPNLYGFGSPSWIAGVLDPKAVGGPRYFGRTRFAEGDMVTAVQELHADASDDMTVQLRAVAQTLAAEAGPGRSPQDERGLVTQGRELITGELGCTNCHKFHDQGELGSAPDLTGYGSRAWLEEFIRNPRDDRFYADRNDRMPAFAPRSLPPDHHLLTDRELRLLVDWLLD
jgi:quinol-cytochrome oxidoreductase complex cytochrome b subunit/mono/diheme cytochrome c family protein